jgi:hypothetical protein
LLSEISILTAIPLFVELILTYLSYFSLFNRISFLVVLLLTAEFVFSQDSSVAQVGGYRNIEWTSLMPQADLEALLNPPESLDDIADGSLQDEIASQIKVAIEKAGDSRYQQALVSTQIVGSFDGQAIRLPGFIVPLEFGKDRHHVTKFFLVPYFGACIHVPPPPPNQIIYADYEKGFKLTSLYDPFWLSGVLHTTLIENDTATSAYAIVVDSIEPYIE